MNKNLFIALALCLAACSEQNKSEEKKEPEAVAQTIDTAAFEKHELRLNLMIGKEYEQNANVKSTIIQTFDGQEMIVGMEITSKTTFKVLDLKNDEYSMQVKYGSAAMKMNLTSGSKEFSSEKNDKTDILSTFLSSIKNKPFFIKMTTLGKVTEIKGLDGLFDNMFAKYPTIDPVKKQQLKDQLMQSYGEKALKGNIEMSTAIFPSVPISMVERWPVTIYIEAGISGKIDGVFQLKEFNDSTYQVLGDSYFETVNKDAYVETNGMPAKYDLKGSVTSKILVDSKTGWIKHSAISQSFDGSANIMDNPKLPGGVDVPVRMISENTISE